MFSLRLGGWLDELARTLLQLRLGSLLFILIGGIGGCDQAWCALIGNISRSEADMPSLTHLE